MSVVPPREDSGMRPRHRYTDRDGSSSCATCGQSALAPIHWTTPPDDEPIDKPMGALDFAEAVAQLSAIANDLGLRVPAFRSPPLNGATQRQIVSDRHGAIVRVKMRGRPASETKRDMCDGLAEANGLHHDHPKRWTLLDRMEIE